MAERLRLAGPRWCGVCGARLRETEEPRCTRRVLGVWDSPSWIIGGDEFLHPDCGAGWRALVAIPWATPWSPRP
jgi:hypothetical protein